MGGSSKSLLIAWVTLGGLLLVLGDLESKNWLPGTVGLVSLGVWAAGMLLLGSSKRADAIEGAIRAAIRTPSARAAVLVLAVLWLFAADLLGVHAALILLTFAGCCGFVVAARNARALAGALMNSATAGVALMLTLFALEALLHVPAVEARLGTPAERGRWIERRYDRLWQRNIFGFRSPHETIARDSCTLRIVALGDSFTWGDKIASSDDTWPARLEQKLALEIPGRSVEVINMGRNGFTTANEAELLRRLGWSFDPDVVIVQYFRNDPLPSGPNFQREGSQYVTPPRRLLPMSFRQGRIASSALLYLLEARYSMLRAGSRPEAWFALYDDGFEGWRQVTDALHEMGKSAAKRGVPIYFVLFPDPAPGTWDSRSHPDHVIHRQVMDAAEASGMGVVDLTPVFADGRTDGQSWWATPYDRHPNEAAHSITAETLRDVLLADGAALENLTCRAARRG